MWSTQDKNGAYYYCCFPRSERTISSQQKPGSRYKLPPLPRSSRPPPCPTMSDTSNKLEVTHVAKGKTTNVVHDRKQSLIQQSNVRTRSYLAIEKNVVMPGILLEDHGIPAVTTFGDFLDELLAHAQTLKPTATVEPPLDKSNFQEILRRVDDSLQSCEAQHTGESAETKRGHRYAIVETAVRDAFTYMVVSSRGNSQRGHGLNVAGDHISRVAGICSSVESPRHRLDPGQCRTVRS